MLDLKRKLIRFSEMSCPNISRIKRTMLTCFSVEDLNREARKIAFLERERDIKPLPLIVSMLTALGGGRW